jgi:hypothetical protein
VAKKGSHARGAGKSRPETVVKTGRTGRPQVQRRQARGMTAKRRRLFLDHLAATCNVTASATAAGVNWHVAYSLRRRDTDFAAEWQAALETGYARLEALLIERAGGGGRAPDDDDDDDRGSDPEGPPPPDPAGVDSELALHLLRMHRGPLRGRPNRGGGVALGRADKKDLTAAIMRHLRVLRRRLEEQEGRA